MTLPSQYAPGGISRLDAKKTIVSGVRRGGSTNYTIRLIENRIGNAATTHQHRGDHNDIEMVPMDSFDEVNVITDYVAHSRTAGDFSYDDDAMELDQRYLQTETITLLENLSYLIVDTNFILSHLNILDELKDRAKKDGLRLVIPIAVMHELDGLKSSKRVEKRHTELDLSLSGESVGHLARWANDWVYLCLATNLSVVVGQKMEERLDKLAVKDDAILDCCLYLQKHKQQTLQVLLSNDKNLCMKALLQNLLTVSYRSNMSARVIARTIRKENLLRFGEIKSNTVVTRQVEVPIKQHPVSPQNAYRTVFLEVQKLLLSVVHKCMSTSYGEDLDLLRDYDRSSVATIQDALRVITRFWIPVFSQYLKLFKVFRNNQGNIITDAPQSRDSLDQFIQFWSSVLSTLYREEMSDTQNQALRSLVQRWEQLAESC